MKNLAHSLSTLLPERVVYCDIGARGGLLSPWKELRDVISVMTFEPDPEEHARIVSASPMGDVCFNTALYHEEKRLKFHLTKGRGKSSIYRPNFEFLRLFPDPGRYEIERTIEVDATTLDHLHASGKMRLIDFLKVDVQGAELDILRGGVDFLSKEAVGMELEVEFSPIYEGQPLYYDVDRFVQQSLGMQLQDLRRVNWKLASGMASGSPKGQLIYADALYLRPIQTLGSWLGSVSGERAVHKLRSALLAALAYGYIDYCETVLETRACASFLTKTETDSWAVAIKEYGHNIRYELGPRGRSRLGRWVDRIRPLIRYSPHGFIYEDEHVGSRKIWKWFG